MSELVFCSVFRARNPEVLQNIRAHSPYVDRTFIVLHGNEEENKQNIEFFESQECKDFNLTWQLADIPYSPIALRNTYLKALEPETWCLQFDCDEFLEISGAYQLRSFVQKAEEQEVNKIAFNAHDIRIGLEGEVWDNLSTYFNPLMIKISAGTGWVGETHGGIHTPGMVPKIGNVPYRYFHIKSTASEYLRGCRNYWTAGREASNDTAVPEWMEFKRLTSAAGFNLFDDFYKAMLAGEVPEEIKQWIVMHRDNQNSEARSWFVVYFGLMHPDQNIFLAGNQHLAYDKDRAPYQGEMTY